MEIPLIPDPLTHASQLFGFSPFGLYCHACRHKPRIELDSNRIRIHLKKHVLEPLSSCQAMTVYKHFKVLIDNAKEKGEIDPFLQDNKSHMATECDCGLIFSGSRQFNALRHCKVRGCDKTKLKRVATMRLRCGRHVTLAQVTALYKGSNALTKQFKYDQARDILKPFLLEIEKNDHTYTHMYYPLIFGCSPPTAFQEKVMLDHAMIHDKPEPLTEGFLLTVHHLLEDWLLNYSQKNILMIPGNLRAALQTFDGTEVNEVNQRSTYTMQHSPEYLVSDVKKLFTFAYRRGMFSSKSFDVTNDFEVALFLKELLLEKVTNVSSVPFLVEFCLMFPFRLKEGSITMISCDTLSSVFSKVASTCKAAVCSVICSLKNDAFTVHGLSLIQQIRNGPVLHILYPIVRQMREMSQRIPKRRKCTVDLQGNVIVDQLFFAFDQWCKIVPRTIKELNLIMNKLANGNWWQEVTDVSVPISVKIDQNKAELSIMDVSDQWADDISNDLIDSFCTVMEMVFHGFGGGSARLTEIERATLHHVLWHNSTIYYSSDSIKVYNLASKRFKGVLRKLPPVMGRFYLLLRLFIQAKGLFFKEKSMMIPERVTPGAYTVRHVMREFFSLNALPDMTQVRHFWAGVSNWITGDHGAFLTASQMGSEKMGHTSTTHATAYSSFREGSEELHFNAYHFSIGDTSHSICLSKSDKISLADIRLAMSLTHPTSDPSKGHYLSLSQRSLVEFGYGMNTKKGHCLGLLAPGAGKSDCFLIPTIARAITNKSRRLIIHISPYGFLSSYHFSNASTIILDKLGLTDVVIRTYSSRHISVDCLPHDLVDIDTLPDLLFINLEGMHSLFQHWPLILKGWIDAAVLDRIIIDEIHTVFTESSFRSAYKVFERLPSLGVPIVALTGSLPLFSMPRLARKLCLSTTSTLSDITVIHGSDIIGDFPLGFQIRVSLCHDFEQQVIDFVKVCLGPGPTYTNGIHVFVSEKAIGLRVFENLRHTYNCRLITSEHKREEVQQVASDWSRSAFEVFISTSIALVGNENPRCAFVACAGYVYDSMQIVQAFGRLRGRQRKSEGRLYFAVPMLLPEWRKQADRDRFQRLCNENLLSSNEYDKYILTMSSSSVAAWCEEAASGTNSCALRMLSTAFGKERTECGACLYCHKMSFFLRNARQESIRRLFVEKCHMEATVRVIRKLESLCLSCKSNTCRGFPVVLRGQSSIHLPANRGTCFSWRMCFRCGVSEHNRNIDCFDRRFMYNIACCECWIYKNIPGWTLHETDQCPVKGRLRRLVSYHYLKSNETRSFSDYMRTIYSSAENFQEYMSRMEDLYIR